VVLKLNIAEGRQQVKSRFPISAEYAHAQLILRIILITRGGCRMQMEMEMPPWEIFLFLNSIKIQLEKIFGIDCDISIWGENQSTFQNPGDTYDKTASFFQRVPLRLINWHVSKPHKQGRMYNNMSKASRPRKAGNGSITDLGCKEASVSHNPKPILNRALIEKALEARRLLSFWEGSKTRDLVIQLIQ
jgi:hypothetical protein